MRDALQDIPRLYTALAEWAACMVYILTLKGRRRGWWFAVHAAVMLVVLSVLLVATKNLPIALWVPCMMSAVALMLSMLKLCGRISLMDAAYYCIQAFVLAEFAASLEWQLHCFLMQNEHNYFLKSVLLILVYAGVFLLAWWMTKRLAPDGEPLGVTGRELGVAAIIGAGVFAASNLSFITTASPFSAQYASDIYNIRTIMDFGGLAILHAHYLQGRQLRAVHELEAVRNMMQKQYQQYQISRESIELVNRKYHDLKHQIAVLRAEADVAKRNEFLDRMEAELKVYEAQNKTGNQVLDILLSSKSFYCSQHGINLTCVADGSLLNFIEIMDLSTIFGNALDNAIECEEKITDPEKRLIHLSVSEQQGFVLIRCENYCEELPEFSEGLPRTTKGNTEYHGYGLKSIRYFARKYGGTATVRMEKQWFVLQILLPCTQNDDVGVK